MKETAYKIPGEVSLSIALLADTHNTDPARILASLRTHQPHMIVFPRGVRLFMTEHLHQHKHIHVIKGTSRSIGVTEVVIAEFYACFRFDFLCPVFHGIDRQQLPIVLSVDEVTTCKPFL